MKRCWLIGIVGSLPALCGGCDRPGGDGGAAPIVNRVKGPADTATNGDPETSADGSSLFLPLSLGEAKERAEAEQKRVFIYAFRPDQPVCASWEEELRADAQIVRLLTERTVPIRMNLDDHRIFAFSYGVSRVPCALTLRATGAEIDRLYGPEDSGEFLRRISRHIAGTSDRVAIREQVVTAHHWLAIDLSSQRKHAEAVRELLYCLDFGATHVPGFFDGLGAGVMRDLMGMALQHREARGAVEERYERSTAKLLAGDGSLGDLKLVTVHSTMRRTQHEVLALYDAVKAERPDDPLLPMWKDDLLEALLEAHRYTEAAEGVDVGRRVDERFGKMPASQPAQEDAADRVAERGSDEGRERYQRWLAREISPYYHLLIGLGRVDEAKALADRLLREAPAASTRNGLAWCGYLTGAPTETHLAWAWQAYNMTSGKDPAITDTLVRIVAVRGDREKAIELTRKALAAGVSPDERSMLEETLRAVEASDHPSPAFGPVDAAAADR